MREELKSCAEPVDEEQMRAFWKEWGEAHKEDQLLYSALTTFPPKLRENDTILLTLENRIQENTIKNHQANLMEFLRMELKNNNLSLKIHVTEIQRDIKAYTTEDRFYEMGKKNPNLFELAKKLGLDLEF